MCGDLKDNKTGDDEGINILLVDDDTEFLDMEELFLLNCNDLFCITTTESAQEALQLLINERYDVIISDYMMPGMDGLEFLKRIRDEHQSDIPFVMLTGKGREDVAMETLNLGGDRYIQKGGAPKAQFSVVAQAVEQEFEHYKTKKKLEITQHSVDKALDGIFWVDTDGKFLYTNEIVKDRLGYSSEELKKMYVWDIDPNYPKNSRKQFWDELKNIGHMTMESVHIARDGTRIPVEINSNHIEHDGDEMEFAFVRDIIERKRAEEMIKDLNSLLTAIRNVNQLIIQEDDMMNMMKESCDILLEARNYMKVDIAILNEGTGKITPIVKWGHDDMKWEIDPEGRGNAPRCVKDVIKSRRTMIVEDPMKYCKNCNYFDENMLSNSIHVPMVQKNQITGILVAYLKPEHIISQEEVDLLEEVGGDLAYAREKLIADRRLKEKNRLLTAINEYSLELAAVPSSDNIFAIAAEKLRDITGAKVVSFSTYDKTTSDLVVQYATLSDEKKKRMTRFLGQRIEGFRNKVTPEMYEKIIAEVVGDAGSLHETTFGAISKPMGAIIEKFFGIDWFTGIALIYKNELMGTVIISGGKGTKRPDNEELNAYAGVTANAVRRWLVERERVVNREISDG